MAAMTWVVARDACSSEKKEREEQEEICNKGSSLNHLRHSGLFQHCPVDISLHIRPNISLLFENIISIHRSRYVLGWEVI